MKPLTAEEVRQIVREEMQKNYMSGSPDVPPHSHNGTDGLNIEPTNIQGYSAQPSSTQMFLNDNTGLFELGFASPSQLEPGNTAGHMAQFIQNPTAIIAPIPVVVGNGVGVQGAFNGGYAPDGTVVLFETGTHTTTHLYVRSRGVWYGFLSDSQL